MGEIVNLRLVKKQRAKIEAAAKAAENRARHGRTAIQKQIDTVESQRQRALLDGAKKTDET